jgi:predicted Fe-Mo cluster-binding NifX family protein
MKIAVATESNDPNAEVCTHGARASYFLIFDEEGVLKEIITNPHTSTEKHVGPSVANMLYQMGVNKVVAGRFGPKFKETLHRNKIECIEQTGFAAELVKQLVQ